MPTTKQMTDEELADRIEQTDVDPAQWRDASPLRAITSALIVSDAAERNLIDAVATARAADLSWTEIAMMLGVSRQAARQRFGDAVTGRQTGRLVEDPDSPRVRLRRLP
jgi:hypothetical protein